MILATTRSRTSSGSWRSSAPRAPRSARCTAPRARRCSATPPRRTASGRSSTGTRHGWAAFVSDPEVPPILKEAGHIGKPQAAGVPRHLRQREGPTMSAIDRPARVGLVTDQTGPLSFMGIANANVAKMVDRRHQRPRGPARSPGRAVRRGQRHRRRSRRGGRGQARRAGGRRRRRSAASTAPPARPSRARSSTRPRSSTSTRSSTRARSATR